MHQSFIAGLHDSLGKKYPVYMCHDEYVGRTVNGSTIKLEYTLNHGCHYSCTLDQNGVIADVSFHETIQNACWMPAW